MVKAHDDDLAMIGLRITLRGLRMASDAVLGDGEPRAVPVGKRPWHVLMGQLGYCRMTVDATQRVAVHAAGKLIRGHEQRAHLSVGVWPCVSRAAMAAEACRIVEFSSALRAHGLRPNGDRH